MLIKSVLLQSLSVMDEDKISCFSVCAAWILNKVTSLYCHILCWFKTEINENEPNCAFPGELH